MINKLAHQTQKTAGIPNGLRTATVAAVSASGVTLSINGAQVGPFACIDTMQPAVGDVVSVFRQDSTWIILGRPNLSPSPWVTQTLLNGWTGTFATRLIHANGLSMQVVIQAVPGTKTDNTTVGQLAAPFLVKTLFDVEGSAGTTVSGGGSPHFTFRTTGVISCQGYSASSTASLQAIIPLDL